MNRDLTIADAGKMCACTIHGLKVIDGKIQYGRKSRECSGNTNEYFFICQNVYSGDYPDNRFGYKFAWCVGTGTMSNLEEDRVEHLEVVEPDLTLDDIDFEDIVKRGGN